MESYNLTMASKQAQSGKASTFTPPRRKTLAEALEWAKNRRLTPQQQRIKEKYGYKYACSGQGEGIIFK